MTWIREIAGWLLVGLGLFIFYISFLILLTDGPWLLEAIFVTFIGFIVFRGGIQLLRVGLASRVCLRASRRAIAETSVPAPRSVLLTRERTSVRRGWFGERGS